jgi:hypothetical protein
MPHSGLNFASLTPLFVTSCNAECQVSFLSLFSLSRALAASVIRLIPFEIQRGHWKTHRVLCKQLQRPLRPMEELALSSPRDPALIQDLQNMAEEVTWEICALVMRLALHLGKSTQRNHSTCVQLFFDWDSEASTVRQRLQFTRGDVITPEQHHEEESGPVPSKQDFDKRKPRTMPQRKGTAMSFMILYGRDPLRDVPGLSVNRFIC